jgi:hypothetical protein
VGYVQLTKTMTRHPTTSITFVCVLFAGACAAELGDRDVGASYGLRYKFSGVSDTTAGHCGG